MTARTPTGTARRLPRGVLLDLPGGQYILLPGDMTQAHDGMSVYVYQIDDDGNLNAAGISYGVQGAVWAVNIWDEDGEHHECAMMNFREMLRGNGRDCTLYRGSGSLGTG